MLPAVLAAAPVACALCLLLPRLVDDEAGMRLLGTSRCSPWLLAAAGVAGALVVSLLWPGFAPPGGLAAAESAALGAAAAATPLLAWIDLRIRRLPDRIVLPLAALMAALLALASSWAALLTGLVAAAALLVLSLLGGRGRGLAIGLGDVKLMLVLGFVTGLADPLVGVGAFVLAHLTGAAEAAFRTVVRRRPLTSRFALGPHLLLGMWAAPMLLTALG